MTVRDIDMLALAKDQAATPGIRAAELDRLAGVLGSGDARRGELTMLSDGAAVAARPAVSAEHSLPSRELFHFESDA
jgi:hypothetical protein